MRQLLARARASKPWRAWKRYGDARGEVLAGGITYFAFLSLFPAVTLSLTVFGFVLRGQPELLDSVFDSLSAYLPGLIRDAQHPDGLIPIQAPPATALTIAGVVSFVTLVLAGMGWLGAVREGIRAVFGARGSVGNLVTAKLRDLGVLLTLGLGILLSAALTIVVGASAGWIAERIGMSGQGWVLALAGFLVNVVVDTGVMMLLMGVLSGVTVPWRVLFQGALVGGVGLSLLKLFAEAVLPRLTANPLFASIAVVFGLLIWLNLLARITLMSAAWAANDVDELHGDGAQALAPGTGTAARSGSSTARADSLPTFGERSRDRTTLAAGAVLGAGAMVAASALARGIRSAVGLARR